MNAFIKLNKISYKLARITNFTSYNFSFINKYIPSEKLKFNYTINSVIISSNKNGLNTILNSFDSKLCLIYKRDLIFENQCTTNQYRYYEKKLNSLLCLCPVIFIELKYAVFYLILLSPLFISSRMFQLKITKLNESTLKEIYLFKKGSKILFKTLNNNLYVLNIKDIISSNLNKEETVINIKTFDSKFSILIDKQNIKYINKEVLFTSLLSKREINTNESKDIYKRTDKLKDQYQINKNVIQILIDKSFIFNSRIRKTLKNNLNKVKNHYDLIKLFKNKSLKINCFIRCKKVIYSNNLVNRNNKNIIRMYIKISNSTSIFDYNRLNQINKSIILTNNRAKYMSISYSDFDKKTKEINFKLNTHSINKDLLNSKKIYKIDQYKSEKRFKLKTGGIGFLKYFSLVDENKMSRNKLFESKGIGRQLRKRKILEYLFL